MLAGKVKLRTFLLVSTVVGAGAIFALYRLWPARSASSETPQPRAVTPTPTPTPDPAPDQDPAPDLTTRPDTTATSAGANLRAVDREVLAWQGKDLGKDKLKDATKGRAYKVNLYQDAGQSSVNRAKIDLDRDDKFDEKWTFDGPNISRKVAPADDENYTESFIWNGSEWARE